MADLKLAGVRDAVRLASMIIATLIVFTGSARAAGDGAIVPLSADAKAAAEKDLPGVVGEPVPAFAIDPSLASLSAGTRPFEIVSGDDKGKTEQHRISAGKKPDAWRYGVGKRTMHLHEKNGESLGIVSEVDTDEGVITRYSPPEPLLIAGMQAGDEKKTTIKVRVYDLDDPSDLEYEGHLDLILTYIGAYKVTVPAGTFDAAALRWKYEGKVGPASIDDIQVMFIAKDVGVVAMAEKRDISAMLVYNENTKVGKVLKMK